MTDDNNTKTIQQEFFTTQQGEYEYVICELSAAEKKYREREQIPFPNFLNSGLALCGVLKKDETIEEWITRKNERHERKNKQ